MRDLAAPRDRCRPEGRRPIEARRIAQGPKSVLPPDTVDELLQLRYL
jgi:hypothetical protein